MRGIYFTSLDREWVREFLSFHPHQVQNTLSWFDFLRGYSKEADRSVTIFLDGKTIGFVPALQHKSLIQSLPYPASYSGIFLEKNLSVEIGGAVVDGLTEYYGDCADVLSVCTSPLTNDSTRIEDHFDLIARSNIQYIDLTGEFLANTTSKFRNNLQRNISKADKAGVVLLDSDEPEEIAKWYPVYKKRMQELESAVLDISYFDAMRQHLVDAKNFKMVNAYVDGVCIGGIILVHNSCCADYYLSVFDRDFDATQASTSALFHSLKWAKAAGIRYFNMQATPKSQRMLYQFKQSWGARDGSHSYLVKFLRNKDEILRQTSDQIQKEYRFHYLVPFDALDQGVPVC